MYELLNLVFAICIFKKGPQDIPVSSALIRLLLPIYAAISFLILILTTRWLDAILQVLVEIILILGISWTIVSFVNKTARYQQTACALVATDALISFIALPAISALTVQSNGLFYIYIILLTVWHWAVSGYIFSHTLEQPLVLGLAVSFMYVLTAYQVIEAIFPIAIFAP